METAKSFFLFTHNDNLDLLNIKYTRCAFIIDLSLADVSVSPDDRNAEYELHKIRVFHKYDYEHVHKVNEND